MILHQEALKQCVANGRILFLSDNSPHYNTSSIDVTLGDWVIRYRSEIGQAPMSQRPFRLDDAKACRDAFGDPFRVPSAGLILEPGECVLAHTHEFIGGADDRIVAMIKDRSTLGRYFLTTHTGAGWGDVGYHNRWTLEIKNSSPRPVVLPHRARIAQVVFFEGQPTYSTYYRESGHYQKRSLDDMFFDEAAEAWDPLTMLPKPLK